LDCVSSPIFADHNRWRYWKSLCKKGDYVSALNIHREAVSITKPLGIRPYLDRLSNNLSLTSSLQSSKSLNFPSADTLLTRRRIEVLRDIVKGMPNKEAAESLYISSRTVEIHVVGAM